MNIINPSCLVPVNLYGLDFRWQDSLEVGFSFPCDKEGNPLLKEMPTPARENLKKCLSGEHAVIPQGVRDYSYTYLQYAQGRCECGGIIELFDPMTNHCECGRLYNGNGQSLAPRE